MRSKRNLFFVSFLIVFPLFLTYDIAAEGGFGDMDYMEGQDMPMDELIYDDLIVAGSECVGFDCVDNEFFDFDTIILKENNLQILFNDTSSAYFPDNDWRITINDSIHGGDDYFAIDDVSSQTRPFTIMAGSPDNAFYLMNYGYIGIGTSAPDVKLHVSNGDIKLDDNRRLFLGSSHTTDARIMHNDSNNSLDIISGFRESGHMMRFGIGCGDSWCARMIIDSNGNVGMGTTSPSYPLEMKSGAHCTTGGVWTDASSREYKKNIKGLSTDEAMNALSGLKPVRFNYKADLEENHVGFIAEDVPDLVATNDRKGLSPMDITAVLTKVVQEQQKTIAELSNRVSDLETELRGRENSI